VQLLYPIGLLAAAGILVPLLIHLWKVKQGKTLKIGNIALLGQSSSQNSKSLRLTDWLLLVLRCLLLLLLAFILAEPYIHPKPERSLAKGWILMEKHEFPSIYQNNKHAIDSLLRSGYELHDFNLEFKQLSLQDTIIQDTTTSPPSIAAASLLKQLNALIPVSQVYLYGSRRLNGMLQELPVVAFNLKWLDLPHTDTLSSWTSTFQGKSLEVHSSPAATWFKPNGQQLNSHKITVLIAQKAYPADETYVKAAIAAMADFTKIRVEVKPWSRENFNRYKPDVVFWLSDEPLDPVLLKSWKKEARLFSYGNGKTQDLKTVIKFKQASPGNVPAVLLKRRLLVQEDKGAAVWMDGYGSALLSVEKKPGLTHYSFFSRLNPQWTDLVWNPQFVKLMMPVVMGTAGSYTDFGFDDHSEDQRVMAKNQPLYLHGAPNVNNVKMDVQKGISLLIWIFAWVVFMLERILSMRNKNKTKA
jgi:hypothetical protein